jgi:RNA polymerase sigma-B factor
VSLDAPSRGDNETTRRLDTLGGEDDRLGRVDEQATVFAAAQRLPERERRILYLRFGEDLTQAEIADRVGVSQMQVSRLLRKSVQRLQELTQARPPRS